MSKNTLKVSEVDAFVKQFTDAGWKSEVESYSLIYTAHTSYTLTFSMRTWYGNFVWYSVLLKVNTPTERGAASGRRSSVTITSRGYFEGKWTPGRWAANYLLGLSKRDVQELADRTPKQEAA